MTPSLTFLSNLLLSYLKNSNFELEDRNGDKIMPLNDCVTNFFFKSSDESEKTSINHQVMQQNVGIGLATSPT